MIDFHSSKYENIPLNEISGMFSFGKKRGRKEGFLKGAAHGFRCLSCLYSTDRLCPNFAEKENSLRQNCKWFWTENGKPLLLAAVFFAKGSLKKEERQKRGFYGKKGERLGVPLPFMVIE